MKNKIAYFVASLSMSSVVAPLLVFAAPAIPPAPPSLTSIDAFKTFLCTTIYGWVFFFFIFLAVLFVLVAAYKYLTAGGDPEKVKAASNMLIYVAVAIIVALLARGLPLLLYTFLGGTGTSAGGCETTTG